MRLRNWFATVAITLFVGVTQTQADPAKAEDEAYKMAVRYTQQGFLMSPTNHFGLGGSGYTMKFNFYSVSKGVDYVFLAGGDLAAKDIDMYVYDEVGSLILDDRRTDSKAGVKFRSSYSGYVVVYVHIARASGLASFSLLVGRRGVEKDSPTGPSESATPSQAK